MNEHQHFNLHVVGRTFCRDKYTMLSVFKALNAYFV